MVQKRVLQNIKTNPENYDSQSSDEAFLERPEMPGYSTNNQHSITEGENSKLNEIIAEHPADDITA